MHLRLDPAPTATPELRSRSSQPPGLNWKVARNLYILAGALFLFAAISFVMAVTAGHTQPNLPANGTLWKTAALFLTVGGLIVALLGIITALFEQIDRRSEERRLRQMGRPGSKLRDR